MGLGDFVSGIFGSKNKEAEKVDPYKQQNPNAYNYGGQPGGADEAANRYRGQGEAAQQRAASQADYAAAGADRNQAYGARMAQERAADLMWNRATGQAPSVAQMQADRQMGQAAAAQQAAAASARGPAGLAMAQQNAAANTAAAQSQIGAQAQVNAAQERQQAEQAVFGAYSGMRGQDYQSQALAQQAAQTNAVLSAQQRAQNDQFQMGMTQAEMGVRGAQLGASQNQEAAAAANYNAARGIQAGAAGQNAATNNSNAWGLIGMAANIGGGLATGSDERMKDNVTPLQAAAAHDLDEHTRLLAAIKGAQNYQAPELMDPERRQRFGLAEPMRDSQKYAKTDMATFDSRAAEKARNQAALDQQARQRAIGMSQTADEAQAEKIARANLGESAKAEGKAVAAKKEGGEEKSSKAKNILGGISDIAGRAAQGGGTYTPGAYYAPQMIQTQMPTLSDERTKDGVAALTGSSAMAQGTGDPSSYATKGGGIDVMGSFGRINAGVSGAMRHPMAGGMSSDERAKTDEHRVSPGDFVASRMHDPMADANRAMRGYSYEYKPQFAGQEGQAPGEKNVGPMAQNMAANPITATAVKKDPATGLLELDQAKTLKLNSAGIASLQDQLDELKARIGRGGK